MERNGAEQTVDTVVVGGGFAGVTAARDLARAGKRVVLLEARDRLGGRTWYRAFGDTDKHVEFGGTWVCPNAGWDRIRSELAHYGIGCVQSPEPQHLLWALGGEMRSGFPIGWEEAVDFEKAMAHLIAASRTMHFGEPLSEESARYDVSVAEYLDGLGVSPVVRDLVSAVAGFMLGGRLDEISLVGLLKYMAGWDNSAFMVYAAIVDKIDGGTKRLIDAMIDEAGVEVRTSTPVASVAQDGTGVTVTTVDGARVRAGAAVIAVPLNLLKSIEFSPRLDERWYRASEQGNAGHATKIWAHVDGIEPTSVIGMKGPLRWVGTEYDMPQGHLLTGFGNDPEELDVTSIEDVQAALEAVIPGVRVLALDAHDWNADPYSQGAWMSWRAGLAKEMLGRIPIADGRLVMAGGDITPRWVGTIEGAIESGVAAAAETVGILATAPTAEGQPSGV
ncbi:MAG TPA: NAD(P)/FAD-dependent oxidoreductase [Capillimicrobium sp.]|nr:NAD(P)/FAD-dependent oxidoreductase [Capillimicrobium sp.]